MSIRVLKCSGALKSLRAAALLGQDRFGCSPRVSRRAWGGGFWRQQGRRCCVLLQRRNIRLGDPAHRSFPTDTGPLELALEMLNESVCKAAAKGSCRIRGVMRILLQKGPEMPGKVTGSYSGVELTELGPAKAGRRRGCGCVG